MVDFCYEGFCSWGWWVRVGWGGGERGRVENTYRGHVVEWRSLIINIVPEVGLWVWGDDIAGHGGGSGVVPEFCRMGYLKDE